jgi:hypothetical protein
MKASDADADSYVLNVVTNDYESIDTILKEACEWAAEEGKALSSDCACEALLRLLGQGLVYRYRFDAPSSGYVAVGAGESQSLEGYWYMASAQDPQRE